MSQIKSNTCFFTLLHWYIIEQTQKINRYSSYKLELSLAKKTINNFTKKDYKNIDINKFLKRSIFDFINNTRTRTINEWHYKHLLDIMQFIDDAQYKENICEVCVNFTKLMHNIC